MSWWEYYPAVALVAILGGFWGWHARQARRLRRAVAEAIARLGGSYEPGGRFSGGTLHVKSGGRDITFCFYLSHSRRSESTSVVAILRKVVAEKFLLKGRDAVARAPSLERYSTWLAPLTLQVESNLLMIRLYGVVRDVDRLVELAAAAAALAEEVDKGR